MTDPVRDAQTARPTNIAPNGVGKITAVIMAAVLTSIIVAIGYAQGLVTANTSSITTFQSTSNGLGTVSRLPHVNSAGALSVLPSTTSIRVVRDGYNASGDGGVGVYTSSNSACPMNAGAGDNGLQVRSADSKCWLLDTKLTHLTPYTYGAVGDGVAGDDAAVMASYAAGAVDIPAGNFHLTSAHRFTGNVNFSPGAMFTQDAAITILGNATASPNAKVFSGAGAVNLYGQKSSVYTEWFGAVADGTTPNETAFQATANALTNGGTIQFNSGSYACTGTVVCMAPPSNVAVVCAGYATNFAPTVSGGGSIFYFNGQNNHMSGGCTATSPGRVTNTPTANTFLHTGPLSGVSVFEDVSVIDMNGIFGEGGNAHTFRNWRINTCLRCIRTGGTSNVFFGDIAWDEITLIPSFSGGIGWLMDGGTNAQYRHRIEVVGGAVGDQIQMTGTETSVGWTRPANIWCWDCNIDQTENGSSIIIAGWYIEYVDSNVSSASNGATIDIRPAHPSDVDGVDFNHCQIMTSSGNGILWEGGRNLKIENSKFVGNGSSSSGKLAAVEIKGGTQGLFMMTGTLAGTSSSGESGWGNDLASYQSYAVNMAATSMSDDPGGEANPLGYGTVIGVKGRVYIVNNMLGGNALGAINGTGAPTGGRNITTPNMTN